MRKRTRGKIAQDLNDAIADLHLVLQELNGAAWYFERDAEIKGFNLAYAAQRNAAAFVWKLKKLLDKYAKPLKSKKVGVTRVERA